MQTSWRGMLGRGPNSTAASSSRGQTLVASPTRMSGGRGMPLTSFMTCTRSTRVLSSPKTPQPALAHCRLLFYDPLLPHCRVPLSTSGPVAVTVSPYPASLPSSHVASRPQYPSQARLLLTPEVLPARVCRQGQHLPRLHTVVNKNNWPLPATSPNLLSPPLRCLPAITNLLVAFPSAALLCHLARSTDSVSS